MGSINDTVIKATFKGLKVLVTWIVIEGGKAVIKYTGEKGKEFLEKRREKKQKKEEENQANASTVNVVNDPDKVKMSANRPMRNSIIEGWIEAGDVGYIVAPSGVGKSTLAVGLACAMASGDITVLNPEVKAFKHQVLYYMLDMRADTVKLNFPQMADCYPMLKCGNAIGGMELDRLVADIRSEVKGTKETYVTVIVDNLNRVKNKKALHEALERLREEVKDADDKILTAIILNHTSTDYDSKRSHLPITMADAEGFKDDYRNSDFFIALNNTRYGHDYAIINQRKVRTGKKKEESIIVGREESPLRFVYLGEGDELDLLPEQKTATKVNGQNWTLQQELDTKGPKKKAVRSTAPKIYTDEQLERFRQCFEEAQKDAKMNKELSARYAALTVVGDEAQWKTLLRRTGMA